MATDLHSIIAHHRLRGDFKLSGGGQADAYIDLRSALLCWRCAPELTGWYIDQIPDGGYVPVATGTFGALLLGHLAAAGWGGVLWNPKGHGVEWSGGDAPRSRDVVLLDDVVTTGGTLRALRAACEARGWRVVREIVAWRASTEDREGDAGSGVTTSSGTSKGD